MWMLLLYKWKEQWVTSLLLWQVGRPSPVSLLSDGHITTQPNRYHESQHSDQCCFSRYYIQQHSLKTNTTQTETWPNSPWQKLFCLGPNFLGHLENWTRFFKKELWKISAEGIFVSAEEKLPAECLRHHVIIHTKSKHLLDKRQFHTLPTWSRSGFSTHFKTATKTLTIVEILANTVYI